MNTETIIRGLTIGSLAGLLLGVGLRLTLGEVVESLRKCRLTLIVLVNFVLVPIVSVAATRAFGLAPELAIGMVLLGAAPFAPVVPVFTKMVRADLALAAGLTALFPVLCAALTPLVCALGLRAMPGAGELRFSTGGILLTLLGTITLPLALGVLANRMWPHLRQHALRWVELIAEATGALSLAFVTVVQLPAILATGWQALFAMVLVSEVSQRRVSRTTAVGRSGSCAARRGTGLDPGPCSPCTAATSHAVDAHIRSELGSHTKPGLHTRRLPQRAVSSPQLKPWRLAIARRIGSMYPCTSR